MKVIDNIQIPESRFAVVPNAGGPGIDQKFLVFFPGAMRHTYPDGVSPSSNQFLDFFL